MTMRVQTEADWFQNPSDPSSVANAKMAMHCMDRILAMGGQLKLSHSSELGKLFAPAFLQCPNELRQVCGALIESDSVGEDETDYLEEFSEDDDLEDELLDPPELIAQRRERMLCSIVTIDDFPCFPITHKNTKVENSPSNSLAEKKQPSKFLLGSKGHEWVVGMLKTPTPESRRLFAAARKALSVFIKKGDARTKKRQGNQERRTELREEHIPKGLHSKKSIRFLG